MISINNKRLANAVGSKTARACDSCIKKRARWYCASDDAFLCQSCDVAVHSANPLASRHKRLRLKAASFKSLDSLVSKGTARGFCDVKVPLWHQGFKRKARTPRQGKTHSAFRVPEDGYDPVSSLEETEDDTKLPQVYRVPVYNHFVNGIEPKTYHCGNNDEATRFTFSSEAEDVNIKEFLTTEIDLAEYEADVGMLLEKEFEFSLNEPCKEEEFYSESKMGIKIKLEAVDEVSDERNKPMMNLDFEDDKKAVINMGFCLRLDHEAVISAWAAHGGSPWTTGARPDVDVDDSWPEYPGSHGLSELARPHQEARIGAIWANPCDGGREARVSRYREKRRTRLFSKKIRYEVRKLNAEKRPRMKGRFIKRSSFEPPQLLL